MDGHWIVDLSLDRTVAISRGDAVDREAFFEWLWAHCDGLVGVDEGSVAAEDAAALGLVPSPRVLDAAATPPDRDWVADAAVPVVACWFTSQAAAAAAVTLLAGIGGCRVTGIRHEAAVAVPDWRSGFGPIVVPGFGTVFPAWEDGMAAATAAGVRMFIEPGAGFGTGLHETTQLCLRALAEWQAGGGPLDRVLDFGSGSGILGIAAAVLGAAHVDAVESDTAVHAAIRSNAVRNGVGARVRVAESLAAGDGPCDLVMANIVADVLAKHADDLCRRVRGARASQLILSGLLADDVPRIVAAYAAALPAAPRITVAGEWRCVVFSITP